MKSEDLARIVEFRNQVESQQVGVKYITDLDIETLVKTEYLKETFGDDEVAKTLLYSDMSYEDLADPEKYDIVYSILSSKL